MINNSKVMRLVNHTINPDDVIKGTWATKEVSIAGMRLSHAESYKYRNHSPSGFEWGSGWSGSAQLALALLLCFVSPGLACINYEKFKWEIIAGLPQGNFELPVKAVIEWIEKRVKRLD